MTISGPHIAAYVMFLNGVTLCDRKKALSRCSHFYLHQYIKIISLNSLVW